MNSFNRLLAMAALGLAAATSYSQAPQGYYSSCEGKSGQDLLKALYSVVGPHTNVGYDGLWEVYETSDVRPDGTLWDIYTTKQWPSNFTRCGNYKLIGDCVNREHSMPKSWWGGGKKEQYSDAFHLYPTDGKVNGQRSADPYGECANGTRLPDNGSVHALGRSGTSTFAGYTGTVFEPDDEYKGDLARTYFYMAACYNDRIASWSSPMLAGNAFPVFTTWSVNLLLKWARQDEVSEKEINRNNAIYQHQHNRNPFIDHPELVEYIWGDKQGQAWYADAATHPDIQQPVRDVEISLGYAAVGVERRVSVPLKCSNVEGDVELSVSTTSAGGSFRVEPQRVSASAANDGTELTIVFTATAAGTYLSTLGVSVDGLEREVDLRVEAVDGLPLSVSDISPDGFSVNWVNLHPSDAAAMYQLSVAQGSQTLAGYPRQVAASAETYRVSGVDASTTYNVSVTPTGMAARTIQVTTADLVPSIDVLFDGDLYFQAEPGVASEAAELMLDIENVADDIKVSVDAPFEVSTDKSTWGRSIVLDPEEDRFYLRVNSAEAGIFDTSILITAGGYSTDDAEASAAVGVDQTINFLETFNIEDAKTYSPYKTATTFTGTACLWRLDDAGLGTDSQDLAINGSTIVRMGKTVSSQLSMAEDKQRGIGTATFDAAVWSGDATAVFDLEYSADGGLTWQKINSYSIDATTSTTCSATINAPGQGRLRFTQTAGRRFFIDNVAISDYVTTASVNELPYHTWDAYCRNSALVVEINDAPAHVAIYSIDGLTWLDQTITPGHHTYNLPRGLYIVVSNDYARRVLLK